jgi:hypothetical protein
MDAYVKRPSGPIYLPLKDGDWFLCFRNGDLTKPLVISKKNLFEEILSSAKDTELLDVFVAGTLIHATAKLNFIQGSGALSGSYDQNTGILTISLPPSGGGGGNTLLNGTVNPTPADGVDGDFYINTTTNFIFGPKAAGAWPSGVSIVGPAGSPGTPGTPGAPGSVIYYGAGVPSGGLGIDGDYYIRTSNGDLYSKSGGSWSVIMNIMGPAGAPGANGLNADMTRSSVTSNSIATGSKSFNYTAASLNLGWAVGTRLRAYNSVGNYMEGTVSTVSSTAVTITVDVAIGSGTFTAWDLFIAGDSANYTATKSVKIVGINIELDGDQLTPLARKFYSTDAAAARGWRYIEALDLPVAVQNAAYPYVAQEYISGNFGAAIIKVPGSNVIFSAYTTGSSVIATDTVTGAILSTTVVTGAIGLVYVASTAQVWAFGNSSNIFRFNSTTGAFIASTAVASLTASCRGVYDDSLVTGNVFAYNGTTMNVINATTYARTGVSIAGSGSGSNELTLCTSGAQSGLLIGTLNTGIFGFNKATNTSAFIPNGMAINYIKWVDSLGAYVGGSIANHTLNIITPTSSTALSITSTLSGILTPYQFVVDEAEDRIFALSANPALMQKRIYVIKLSTLSWIKVTLSTTTTTSSGTFGVIDTANKTIYAVGTANGGSIAKIVYG